MKKNLKKVSKKFKFGLLVNKLLYSELLNFFRRPTIANKGCLKECVWCKDDLSYVIKMPPNKETKYNNHTWINYICTSCSNQYRKNAPKPKTK